MDVGMWMSREPVTIGRDASVFDAAQLMARKRVRRLLVVDGTADGARLLGIVSSHDVWRACPPDCNPLAATEWPAGGERPVSAVMARDVVTVTPDTPIDVAAAILRARRIGALPVVRGARLVGLITESDVLDALVETLGTLEAGTRITFEAHDGEAVVADMAALAAQHGVRLLSVLSLRHRDRTTDTERPVAVVRLAGDAPPALVDAIWKSGHPVRSVVPVGGAAALARSRSGV